MNIRSICFNEEYYFRVMITQNNLLGNHILYLVECISMLLFKIRLAIISWTLVSSVIEDIMWYHFFQKLQWEFTIPVNHLNLFKVLGGEISRIFSMFFFGDLISWGINQWPIQYYYSIHRWYLWRLNVNPLSFRCFSILHTMDVLSM